MTPRHQAGGCARPARGFTLVELMVAMLLGLLITAAVASLFVANKRNYRRNQLVVEMQNNARFAIRTLSNDLTMAGYFGGIDNPADPDALKFYVAPGDLARDCDANADQDGDDDPWVIDTNALAFANEGVMPSSAAVAFGYPCLAGKVVKNSDVLIVRRASRLVGKRYQGPDQDQGVVNLVNLQPNTFYVGSNRTAGGLFFSGADGANDPLRNQPLQLYFRYSSNLYFLSKYSNCDNQPDGEGDSLSTLCRVFYKPSAGIVMEPVAVGVERMEIAFGIDTDADGVANRYSGDPAADGLQLDNAVTARISLLVRSRKPDRSYHNQKTYDLVGYDNSSGYVPNDHYYRRMLGTTVILRNMR